MTFRQILDRAMLRVCNRDIRLRGDWETLPEAVGYEPELAEQILRLLVQPPGSEDEDGEAPEFGRRWELESALKRCSTIDDALTAIGRFGG